VTGAGHSREDFEQLAVPLFDSLFNFSCWLTQDRAEAEDLVQEAYLKALKGFSSFELGTNFRAWMFRILRNTFLTSRTGLRSKIMVSVEDEQEQGAELAVSSQTPESILMERVSQDAVQKAMEQLSLPHREVLVLCDVEEMSYAEIATMLDVPVGTVMSRIARARKAMRAALQPPLAQSKTGAGRS